MVDIGILGIHRYLYSIIIIEYTYVYLCIPCITMSNMYTYVYICLTVFTPYGCHRVSPVFTRGEDVGNGKDGEDGAHWLGGLDFGEKI